MTCYYLNVHFQGKRVNFNQNLHPKILLPTGPISKSRFKNEKSGNNLRQKLEFFLGGNCITFTYLPDHNNTKN